MTDSKTEVLEAKLYKLESEIELLKKYFGDAEYIPHRALEVAFGWEPIEEVQK